MDSRRITRDNLAGLAADLLAAGTAVIAPARGSDGGVDYRPISDATQSVLDGSMPRRSLKEFFLPVTEPLFAWRQRGGAVELEPVPTSFPPRVVIGARPCDAAAVAVMDRVMGWDYRDELWFGRREATTIVSLACTSCDEACFCAAVGLAPDTTKGSDLMLTPDGEGFAVDVVTEKGARLVAEHQARFAAGQPRVSPEPLVAATRAKVAENLTADPGTLRGWLAAHFEHPLWEDVALRCHGCGACASVCPTCHCFDIVDEPEGVAHGVRRRNWDTCQTPTFTVHASGHNPRTQQNARFRQRVMHKFSIYPAKFGEVLCSGCGRCVRCCPGGMNLQEVLARVALLAAAATAPATATTEATA